jgi:hypothetical protein
VAAQSCPYLAGMPPGTRVPYRGHKHVAINKNTGERLPSRDSVVGKEDAFRVPLTVKPGQVLYFREVHGGTGDWSSKGQEYGLDGNERRPTIEEQPVNGYDGMRGPLNAMVGVFLKDGERPDATPFVPGLDFSSPTARDFNTLDPRKKQIFFIGDGVNNRARRLQRFVVPDDVDTLYLGLQDTRGWWWDNFGSVRTTLFTGDVQLVQ